MDDPEIWFKKILGSYWPCSEMGWYLVFGLMAACFAVVGVTTLILNMIGRADLASFSPFAILPVIIYGQTVMARHS